MRMPAAISRHKNSPVPVRGFAWAGQRTIHAGRQLAGRRPIGVDEDSTGPGGWLGCEKGIETGRQAGQVERILSLIEEHFGPTPEAARRELDRPPTEDLRRMALRIGSAASLADLGLPTSYAAGPSTLLVFAPPLPGVQRPLRWAKLRAAPHLLQAVSRGGYR